jgi:5-methylcytosine-specific restriction endonuclease McrA
MTKRRFKITTRKQAKASGQKKYYTGRPCVNGHLSEKYTYNGMCLECGTDWAAVNPEKTKKFRQRWVNNNRDKVRGYNKRWAADNTEQYNAAIDDWHRRNPERTHAAKIRWMKANMRQHIDSGIRWRKNNPEKARAIKQARRAREMKAKGRYTHADIKRLFFVQRGRCAECRCGIVNKYHVDHKMPLSRGGSNYPKNIQLLCESCNTSKGKKTMREWRAYKLKIAKLQLRKAN